jgi:hypothetical protein
MQDFNQDRGALAIELALNLKQGDASAKLSVMNAENCIQKINLEGFAVDRSDDLRCAGCMIILRREVHLAAKSRRNIASHILRPEIIDVLARERPLQFKLIRGGVLKEPRPKIRCRPADDEGIIVSFKFDAMVRTSSAPKEGRSLSVMPPAGPADE